MISPLGLDSVTGGPWTCPGKDFLSETAFDLFPSSRHPPRHLSFFLQLRTWHTGIKQKSVSKKHLVIFLRVDLNILPVLPGPFSPGGELPPPNLPSALALGGGFRLRIQVFLPAPRCWLRFTLTKQSVHCTIDLSHCWLFPSPRFRCCPRWIS